jgi:hypothetical protein
MFLPKVRQKTLDARVDLARMSHRRHVAQALDLLDPHARQHAGDEPRHARAAAVEAVPVMSSVRHVERRKSLERRRLVERGMPLPASAP